MRSVLVGWIACAAVGCSSHADARVPASVVDAGAPSSSASSNGSTSEVTPVERPVTRVVLIALDGARWQEIFHGVDPHFVADDAPAGTLRTAEQLMPHLHALIERGVGLGDQRARSSFLASGPNFVSLPGYSEMLTGKASLCETNDCMRHPDPTLVDEFRALPGVTDDEVMVIASWDVIGRVAAADPANVVVSTGRSAGPTRGSLAKPDDPAFVELVRAGAAAAPSPGGGDYRPDSYTAPIALARFERRPRPRFAFIGLGDTDEHAHGGAYLAYLDDLARADRLLGDLIGITESWGPREAASVVWIVTADHGRSPNFRDHGRDNPSSAGTWLVASGGGIPALGRMEATATHHLADIAPTVRALLRMPDVEGERAGKPIEEIVLGASRAGR